jgi:spore germination protein YaaH
VKNNLYKKAIDLFLTISNPNEHLIVFFLNACAKLSDQHSLNLAKEFLNKINSNYKTNEFILCTAADMFIKVNQIKSAEDYLSKMSKSDIKYRMLMKISNLKNEPEQTFDLYNKMLSDGFKANQITYLLLINASSQIGIENICQKIVKQIPQNLLQNLTIKNALIDMWVKTIKSKTIFSYKINF